MTFAPARSPTSLGAPSLLAAAAISRAGPAVFPPSWEKSNSLKEITEVRGMQFQRL
jgi:hypothetical protein